MLSLRMGIDIGGTKMRAVLLKGKSILSGREMPTPKNQEQFVKSFKSLVAAASPRTKLKIGIGVAGIVRKSKIVFCPNIPYLRNFDLRRLAPRRAQLKMDNDARCFARCEICLGAGKKFDNLLALTIGTGIGRACVKKRKIKKLKSFEYPEPWERKYQYIRDRADDEALINFLGEKIIALAKHYRPSALVIGGGVLERKKILYGLKLKLNNRGFNAPIRRARFKKNAVAVGAALYCG